MISLLGGLDGPLYALLEPPYEEDDEGLQLLMCFGEQGEVRWQSPPLQAYVEKIALSPAGDLLAIDDEDGLRLVRTADGENVRTLSINPMPRWKSGPMFFSPDGRWFGATAWGANFSFVWDVQTGHRVNLLRAGYLAFSGDASRVAGRALEANDGLIHVWEGDYVLESFRKNAKDPAES